VVSNLFSTASPRGWILGESDLGGAGTDDGHRTIFRLEAIRSLLDAEQNVRAKGAMLLVASGRGFDNDLKNSG
jgi:hypothetical protein